MPEGSAEGGSKDGELLHLVLDYVGKIAGERGADAQLLLMADMARGLLACDRCSLWIADGDELRTRVAHDVGELRIPLRSGVAGKCFERGRPIVANDPAACPWFNPDVDRKTGYETRNILAVPIFGSAGNAIGVYQAVNKKEGEFGGHDLRLLMMVAAYSGKSLENARLLEEVEQTQNELVHLLGEAGEVRSRETGNHVKRVGELCYILAREMGLPPQDCDLIRLTAPLHDMGKLGVRDTVLNSPNPLSPEEYEEMKLHTQIGERFLARSDRRVLRVAAQIAGCHHEKWDGSGYPNGLSGEEIPLFARICALADVYDALVNDRCYKKGWPQERVEALFRAESGRHFDPRVVEAFFRCKEEFPQVSRKLLDG